MADAPHVNAPVYTAGADLESASAALVLLHGRGASAADILSLSADLEQPGLAFLAPQAEGYVWYPNRLIAPLEQNEPHLSAALALVDELVKMVETRGIPSGRIFVGGFSQGASLAIEYVIRHPRRYGGLLGFSGGYIWPLDEPRLPQGGLAGTPVLLGCSDTDPYIPLERVHETTALLRSMGAQVTEKIYPRMAHTINDDELRLAKELLGG